MQDLPHQSGIYKIKNKINHKCYIGQSQDISRRVYAHIYALTNGIHDNVHLQRAWDKYGCDNFKISVIEICEPDALDDAEIKYIAQHDSYRTGYNRTLGGGGVRGYCFSEGAKQKMKESHNDYTRGKHPQARPIVLLNTGEHFLCVADAGEKYNVPKADISKNARGKSYYAGQKDGQRLVWKYLDEYCDMSEKDIIDAIQSALIYKKGQSNNKKVICLNNNLIFNSITDANKYANVRCGVGDVCRGLYNSAGVDPVTKEKLRWMFYEEYMQNLTTETRNNSMVVVAS